MSDVTIKYKGQSIATMDASGTKTLQTQGKYCEGDIGVEYVKPAGPTGTKQISITANGTTTEDVTNYASAEITVNVSGGGGGSILSGSVTPATNSNGMTIDVGASFTHFVIYATTNPGGNSIKAFRASICDFSASPTNIVSLATNNSGSGLAGSAQATENQWFTKSGTTVTCATGISGATSPGYWVEGITYQWYAW